MRRTQILLTTEIHTTLAELADKLDTSLSALVRKAVTLTYVKPVTEANMPAFGSWKKTKLSDKALLNKLGGNWKNFPLS